MPYSWLDAKSAFKACKKWSGQRDFGEQDQNLFTQTYRLGNRFKIGFSFARPRDAIKDEGIKAARPNRFHHAGCSRLLCFIQCRRSKVSLWFGQGRVDADRDRFKGASLDKPANDRVTHPSLRRQLAHKPLNAFQCIERCRALRCKPCRFEPRATILRNSA